MDVSDILTQDMRDRGWEVGEEADDTLVITFQGTIKGRFAQGGATHASLYAFIGVEEARMRQVSES